MDEKKEDFGLANTCSTVELVTETELDEKTADYEQAIAATGYGKFHYWLLFVCGWGYASDAIEILCVTFVLPSAECDLKLTSPDKAWLSAIVFVGMMIGGYLWGGLGDSLGRREVLMTAMTVNSLFAIVSCFAMDFPTLLILRFLSGLGVGGSVPVVWSYFTEFQPKARRGTMICIMTTFWFFGNMLVAGMAWLIIPLEFSYETEYFRFNSWRLFTALCGLPSLLVAVLLYTLPESPRYLLARNRTDEALQVFRKIHRINANTSQEFPYDSLVLDKDIVSEEVVLTEGRIAKMKAAARRVWLQSKALFGPQLIKNTLVMTGIQFSLQFGYFGLWMWFPEIFNHLQAYYSVHPNDTVTVCQVINFASENATLSQVVSEDTQFCDQGLPSDQVFINSFIVSLAPLPGSLWTIAHIDRFGRKFFLVMGLIASGLCAFLVYLVKSTTDSLIVLSFFGFFTSITFDAIDCFQTELFPTTVRSTATGLTLIAARLGSILGTLLFGMLVDVICELPILLIASFIIAAGLLGLLLPNTTKTPLG